VGGADAASLWPGEAVGSACEAAADRGAFFAAEFGVGVAAAPATPTGSAARPSTLRLGPTEQAATPSKSTAIESNSATRARVVMINFLGCIERTAATSASPWFPASG
jgi:hypothetical protein